MAAKPNLKLVRVRDTPVPAEQPPPVLSMTLPGLAFDDKPVLGPLVLTLRPGETVALTGPSGVGKTTLMRVIAGLETRHDGHIEKPERAAMVFQEPTLMPWRSVADNLAITLGLSQSEIAKVLLEVGLDGRGNAFPNQLSLGQQRRLSLARAFAGKPDLLLLDEPFVSLDDKLADEMMTLFERLRAKRPVATLIVTHARDEATRLASRILELSGSPARLSTRT